MRMTTNILPTILSPERHRAWLAQLDAEYAELMAQGKRIEALRRLYNAANDEVVASGGVDRRI